MVYLCSRKRFVKHGFEPFDSRSYHNIIDEFSKFNNETHKVCYFQEGHEIGLDFIRSIKLSIQDEEELMKKLSLYISTSDPFVGKDLIYIVRYGERKYTFDIIKYDNKILRCDIIFNWSTSIYFYIEDYKNEEEVVKDISGCLF